MSYLQTLQAQVYGKPLGDRMKDFENVTRNLLLPKEPVIVRIDGMSFHTFVKQKWVKSPFDRNIIAAFCLMTQRICEEVGWVQFAYHQSDEVTFFLKDYEREETQQIFNGNIQKISTLFASKAANYFNYYLRQELKKEYGDSFDIESVKFAEFDARTFNIPKEEVTNNFVWRQRDWIKNSISSYARCFFSDKELEGVNTTDRKKMLLDKGKDWELLEPFIKYGTSFYKVENAVASSQNDVVVRKKWVADTLATQRIEDYRTFLDNLVTYQGKKSQTKIQI
jgi:tRNA(His) 5'-end guanylyltransferase